MRVLVTGAYGPIGSACVAVLPRGTARGALLALFVLSALGAGENIAPAPASRRFSSKRFAFDVPAMLALPFTLAILDER